MGQLHQKREAQLPALLHHSVSLPLSPAGWARVLALEEARESGYRKVI